MLHFVNIPPIVVKGHIIPFHPNGPQCGPSKKQPHFGDLAQRWRDFLPKNPMFQVEWFPWSFFVMDVPSLY